MQSELRTQTKLEKIRQRMKQENIHAFMILSSDFHESEYVGDYFKCREYISGFTGSYTVAKETLDHGRIQTSRGASRPVESPQ